MNTRYLFTPESLCNSAVAVSFSLIPTVREEGTTDDAGPRNQATNRGTTGVSSSFLVRMAIRISRARWYSFARRVFHYQNGPRSNIGSNPFNTSGWMFMELMGLVFQIVVITYTLSVSKEEKPVWPMRTWASGYGAGCVLNLGVLLWRYWVFCWTQVGVEHSVNIEESRKLAGPVLHGFRRTHACNDGRVVVMAVTAAAEWLQQVVMVATAGIAMVVPAVGRTPVSSSHVIIDFK